MRQVSAGRVEDAFRFPGRARRVEDVERVLRVHRFGWAVFWRPRHQLRPPEVAAGLERHGLAGAAQHDDVLDARCVGERLVDVLLQRHDRAAAVAAVGSDQDLCAGVVDPVAQRLGGESAKHDRVHRADAGARQHRDGDFRDHREIDRHAVAAFDAQSLQDVRELVDVGVQLAVRDAPDFAGRLAFPDQRHAAALPRAHVAVETIHRGVELASEEPLRMRRLPLQHPIPRATPLQLLRPVRPISFRVPPRALVRAGVAHVGLGFEGVGRGEPPLLVEECFDPVSRHSLGY